MLEKLNCKVEVVRSGQEACDRVTQSRFDLIFMDCQMPDIDGFEATRLIRRLEAQRDVRTPIVALSASVLPEERQRCLDAEMDEHIPKPVALADLNAVLDRWCSQPAVLPTMAAQSV